MRDSVQIFYLGTFMAKYISGGHIPEHALFKAIVQEGNMVVTSTCGHAQSNIIRSRFI